MEPMRWNGWGDPDQAATLPGPVRDLLAQLLGIDPDRTRPPVAADRIQLREPALPKDFLAAVGTSLEFDATERLRHTRGKSTVDLLRMRLGDGSDAPDAVLRPGSHDEVLAILTAATVARVAVVPFGGGTSVVGGLAPVRDGYAGVVALDLARLAGPTTVDTVARTAELAAGLSGPEAERRLAGNGYTLGHFPQSFEYATIGGFAATRSAGQYSLGYGRFDELVLALRIATPVGTIETGRAPRSAAGPDLRQLFLGSEGAFGVITSVTAQVRPVPAERIREAWRFDAFEAGLAVLRSLVQDGPRPTMARLSDETETYVNATVEGRSASGCQVMIAYEDAGALRDQAGVRSVLAAGGGQRLPEEGSADWSTSRFRAPYLRDALLDAGVLVETLETATFWTAVPSLREAVRTALAAELPGSIVSCHVSHLYPAGAALYFTVVCAQADDPVAQWTRAKTAVTAAILAAGGTVTHHHGVGRDHAAGLAVEIGELARDTLRAVKARLDPAGILNPGVLLG
jgi:alkyldihydroxyacetonephosphate synthase